MQARAKGQREGRASAERTTRGKGLTRKGGCVASLRATQPRQRSDGGRGATTTVTGGVLKGAAPIAEALGECVLFGLNEGRVALALVDGDDVTDQTVALTPEVQADHWRTVDPTTRVPAVQLDFEHGRGRRTSHYRSPPMPHRGSMQMAA